MDRLQPGGDDERHQTASLLSGDPRRIGSYRIERRLGAGGMGTVYLGRDNDGRRVAIKLVHAAWARQAGFRARFRREAYAASRVARFCTAEVIAYDPEAERPYLVTEYVEGPTLAEKVAADGPMPARDVERLAAGVAAALNAIHSAGVIHRDLKPANVLLSPLGPRVIDFGVARALEAANTLTGANQRVGTVAFMSPEQARGELATSAADIYAWGLIVLWAATGELPAKRNPAGPINDESHPRVSRIDPKLRNLVGEALEPDPARRPTADDLLSRVTRAWPARAEAVLGNAEATAEGVAEDSPAAGEDAEAEGDRTEYLPTAPGFQGPAPARSTVEDLAPVAPVAPVGSGAGSGAGPAEVPVRRQRHRPGLVVVAGVAAAAVTIGIVSWAVLANSSGSSGGSRGASPAPAAARPRAVVLPRARTPLGLTTLVWVGDPGHRHYQIYSGTLAGSRLVGRPRSVTTGPRPSVLPVLTPDRATIIFVDSNRLDAIATDGGAVTEDILGRAGATGLIIEKDARPTLSADGRLLAVAAHERGRPPGIYVVALDGSRPPRRLGTTQPHVGDPAWSPLADTIVYWGNADGGDGGELFTIPTSGAGTPTQLTKGYHDADPAWSVDGAIAFRRKTGPSEGDLDIFLIPSGGGTATQLTVDGKRNQDPSFSPDGRRMVFTGEKGGPRELFVMDIRGHGRQTLTRRLTLHPRWDVG